MKIVIGGDICPIGHNASLFNAPEEKSIGPDHVFAGFDLVVANLECPLIDEPTPIVKRGPVLGAPRATASQLASLGIDAVTLANNHILDHGPAGLQTTLQALDEAGIRHLGAGANLSAAAEPLLVRGGGAPIAILGFAEREYSCASRDKPGACPLDVNLVVRRLAALPEGCFTIVLVHGGNEFHPLPSPWLQDTCRLMVELGAKVVICQHSHCIGASERYRDGLIVYGQGNLIFDIPSRHPGWNESVLVSLAVEGTRLIGHEFLPLIQTPGARCFRLADVDESSRILDDMQRLSATVVNQDLLDREWRRFCTARKRAYQDHLFGHGRLARLVNRLTGFADFKSSVGRMNTGNMLRCASHLEVLRTLYSQETTTGIDHETV
jgi:hypothetical protein